MNKKKKIVPSPVLGAAGGVLNPDHPSPPSALGRTSRRSPSHLFQRFKPPDLDPLKGGRASTSSTLSSSQMSTLLTQSLRLSSAPPAKLFWVTCVSEDRSASRTLLHFSTTVAASQRIPALTGCHFSGIQPWSQTWCLMGPLMGTWHPGYGP